MLGHLAVDVLHGHAAELIVATTAAVLGHSSDRMSQCYFDIHGVSFVNAWFLNWLLLRLTGCLLEECKLALLADALGAHLVEFGAQRRVLILVVQKALEVRLQLSVVHELDALLVASLVVARLGERGQELLLFGARQLGQLGDALAQLAQFSSDNF